MYVEVAGECERRELIIECKYMRLCVREASPIPPSASGPHKNSRSRTHGTNFQVQLETSCESVSQSSKPLSHNTCTCSHHEHQEPKPTCRRVSGGT